MKSRVEKQSNIICRMFQDLDPCFYAYHLHSQFLILCQSSDNPYISKFLSDFFDKSMSYFLQNIDLYQTKQGLKKQQFHKAKLSNLIVSCRQEIQEKQIEGSCAFALAYLYQQQLYCIRSQGIQIFLLNQQLRQVKSIDGSYPYKQNKRNRTKNSIDGYFSAQMPNIKAQYLFQQNDLTKKQLYFQRIDTKKHGSNSKLRVLAGCSQTFDLINSQILFKHFFGHIEKSDYQKVKQVLEEAKKQIKSIHRQDLSLICWKIACLSNNQKVKSH